MVDGVTTPTPIQTVASITSEHDQTIDSARPNVPSEREDLSDEMDEEQGDACQGIVRPLPAWQGRILLGLLAVLAVVINAACFDGFLFWLPLLVQANLLSIWINFSRPTISVRLPFVAVQSLLMQAAFVGLGAFLYYSWNADNKYFHRQPGGELVMLAIVLTTGVLTSVLQCVRDRA